MSLLRCLTGFELILSGSAAARIVLSRLRLLAYTSCSDCDAQCSGCFSLDRVASFECFLSVRAAARIVLVPRRLLVCTLCSDCDAQCSGCFSLDRVTGFESILSVRATACIVRAGCDCLRARHAVIVTRSAVADAVAFDLRLSGWLAASRCIPA